MVRKQSGYYSQIITEALKDDYTFLPLKSLLCVGIWQMMPRYVHREDAPVTKCRVARVLYSKKEEGGAYCLDQGCQFLFC